MSVGSPDNEERRLLAEYETAARFYSWAVGGVADRDLTCDCVEKPLSKVNEGEISEDECSLVASDVLHVVVQEAAPRGEHEQRGFLSPVNPDLGTSAAFILSLRLR